MIYKDVKLNSSNDIAFVNGDFVFIEGTQEIKQCVLNILSTNKGERFDNFDFGITFMNLLGKNVTDEKVRNEIVQGLAQDERFQSLESLEIERNTVERTMTIKFTALFNSELIEGEVTI